MKIQRQLDDLGADIRNKLTPLKNLLVLLSSYELEDDPIIKKRIWDNYIKKEMKQSKISINYIKDLL